MRPVVQTRQLRTPEAMKERRRREIAIDRADRLVEDLEASLSGQENELFIEVCRQAIVTLSGLVEARGHVGRAHGVLSCAAKSLSPAHVPKGSGSSEIARVFGRRAA